MMNMVCREEMGDMRTLEQKVDILVRYCTAESAQTRRYYQADLRKMLAGDGPLDMRQSIEWALADLDIPEHLLGYAYLQYAIELVAKQPELAYAMTTRVYRAVGMQFGTTVPLVERAVRHAIERGWNRCDEGMRNLYFGGKLRPDRAKPTNAEFITRIANVVRG
jgi:hypothetical protein